MLRVQAFRFFAAVALLTSGPVLSMAQPSNPREALPTATPLVQYFAAATVKSLEEARGGSALVPIEPVAKAMRTPESRMMSAAVDDEYGMASQHLPRSTGPKRVIGGDKDDLKQLAASPGLRLPDYRLGPGDVIEIIYQLTNRKRDEPYRIDISDELEIVFPYTPKFDARPVVRTDGKIDLPLIGEFDVAGRTTTEVNDEITSRCSRILHEPVVHVRVLKSNATIEELKRAITTSPRGQSRLEPIRPDGFISLPLIGDVSAAGLTIPELSQAIMLKYHEAGVVDIDVTVVLLEVRSPVAYVTGGVITPGPVILQGPMDVWRMIANAGGFTQDADPRHVIVAKSGDNERRLVLSYAEWIASMDGRHNTVIQPGDIVYVPKNVDNYVFVAGEVVHPGPLPVQYNQTLTVSQAIATAGGLTDRGKECQVLVLRKGAFSKPIVCEAPYLQLFDPAYYKSNRPPQDVVLKSGDIVFVPRSRVGDFNKFAKDYFRDGIWTVIPFNVTAGYQLGVWGKR